MNTLKAEKRDLSIKAKKLRRDGFVTGNVFGKAIEGSMPIQIEKAAAERLLKTCSKGTQLMLEVDGQSIDALLKEIDFNPLKKQIDELDFQALVAGEKVHTTAPIELLNHEKIVGALVNQTLYELSYKAVPSALIDRIKIDVADMKLGDSIKVKDLEIANDKDIDIMTDLDATVVTISEIHNAPEETEDAAPVAEEAAAPAKE